MCSFDTALNIIIFYNLFIVNYADAAISGTEFSLLFEETLFLLPILSLMSSPSKSVKGLATDLLHLLEKLIANMFVAPKNKPIVEDRVHYLSTPGIIILRLLRHLWYQVFYPSYHSVFCLNVYYIIYADYIYSFTEAFICCSPE